MYMCLISSKVPRNIAGDPANSAFYCSLASDTPGGNCDVTATAYADTVLPFLLYWVHAHLVILPRPTRRSGSPPLSVQCLARSCDAAGIAAEAPAGGADQRHLRQGACGEEEVLVGGGIAQPLVIACLDEECQAT